MKIHTKSLHKDNQQTPLQVSQPTTAPRAMHNCTFCHEEYHDEQQLTAHMKEMHNELTDTEEVLSCPICQKVETNSSSLEMHMIGNHCPDIAAQCSLCDKRFIHIDNLAHHMQSTHKSDTETLEEAAEQPAEFGNQYIDEEPESFVC